MTYTNDIHPFQDHCSLKRLRSSFYRALFTEQIIRRRIFLRVGENFSILSTTNINFPTKLKNPILPNNRRKKKKKERRKDSFFYGKLFKNFVFEKSLWDQGRHKKTRLRLLDALSNCRGNIHGKKPRVPKQDTRHVDERSVVRGVAMMPGERHDVHRQERTTNRINHTRSLASRRTVVPFYLRRENCLLSYRENRKTRDENERCPLGQHASRNRAEWYGGEGTENGVKMFPRNEIATVGCRDG